MHLKTKPLRIGRLRRDRADGLRNHQHGMGGTRGQDRGHGRGRGWHGRQRRAASLSIASRHWARCRWSRTRTPAGTPFCVTNTSCRPRPTCCAS